MNKGKSNFIENNSLNVMSEETLGILFEMMALDITTEHLLHCFNIFFSLIKIVQSTSSVNNLVIRLHEKIATYLYYSDNSHYNIKAINLFTLPNTLSIYFSINFSNTYRIYALTETLLLSPLPQYISRSFFHLYLIR